LLISSLRYVEMVELYRVKAESLITGLNKRMYNEYFGFLKSGIMNNTAMSLE